MPEARCKVCGREHTSDSTTSVTPEYSITYTGLCDGCSLTLGRALAGIVAMLQDDHGEHQERVMSKLLDGFNHYGFDTDKFRVRRSA